MKPSAIADEHHKLQETAMGCKECDSASSSRRNGAAGFAERALKLALSLPDDVTSHKHFKKPQADFLSSLRDLAASYASAANWSKDELDMRMEALKFGTAVAIHAADAVSVDIRNNNNGGGGESCTAGCSSDLGGCTGSCNGDADAGYFCYFDCRLAYMACLARCVTHGVWGGGGFGTVIA